MREARRITDHSLTHLTSPATFDRQIAERLTLSVRTVGNHLYGAYTRLGAPLPRQIA